MAQTKIYKNGGLLIVDPSDESRKYQLDRYEVNIVNGLLVINELEASTNKFFNIPIADVQNKSGGQIGTTEDDIENYLGSIKSFESLTPAIRIPLLGTYGVIPVNKFGETTNADGDVETDVWDGADVGENQSIWDLPSITALSYTIVSDSVVDNFGGLGANVVKVYGLTAWDEKESSEIVELNGLTEVALVNDYVIIHRMKVQPVAGQTTTNLGNIKCVSSGGDLMAMIVAHVGQTLMAIYGIPYGQSFLMTKYYASGARNAASLTVYVSLKVNPDPHIQTQSFLTKSKVGLASEGTNYAERLYDPNYRIKGPAVIKIDVISSVNNTIVAAGFDGYLIDD